MGAGSASGGLALDWVSRRAQDSTQRCTASAKICASVASMSLPFGIFAALARDQWLFMGSAALFMFCLTMSTAPCVIGMMEAVPLESRGIAMGLASFGAHTFGDVLSPLLVGALKDKFGSL